MRSVADKYLRKTPHGIQLKLLIAERNNPLILVVAVQRFNGKSLCIGYPAPGFEQVIFLPTIVAVLVIVKTEVRPDIYRRNAAQADNIFLFIWLFNRDPAHWRRSIAFRGSAFGHSAHRESKPADSAAVFGPLHAEVINKLLNGKQIQRGWRQRKCDLPHHVV